MQKGVLICLHLRVSHIYDSIYQTLSEVVFKKYLLCCAHLLPMACFHGTVRLIKKVTTFSIVLHGLNSTNLIVIHELFKELQKMNNLPPVPLILIDLFGFYN